MASTLYFPVTENCNLKCRHCYLSAGPGKEDTTVSRGRFDKMIENLPIQNTRVILTGGEVSTIEDDLYYFLERLKIKQEEFSEEKAKLIVEIQTNGTWAKDKNHARDFLSDIDRRGVSFVDISSSSLFHKEMGVSFEMFDNLQELEKYFPSMMVHAPSGFQDSRENTYFPMGRALDFEIDPQNFNFNYTRNPECRRAISLKTDFYDVSVDSKGNVYPCCFRMFQFDGNLAEEKLVDILDRAIQDKDIMLLYRQGVEGVALERGADTTTVRQVLARQGDCGLCARVFGEKVDIEIGRGVAA